MGTAATGQSETDGALDSELVHQVRNIALRPLLPVHLHHCRKSRCDAATFVGFRLGFLVIFLLQETGLMVEPGIKLSKNHVWPHVLWLNYISSCISSLIRIDQPEVWVCAERGVSRGAVQEALEGVPTPFQELR